MGFAEALRFEQRLVHRGVIAEGERIVDDPRPLRAADVEFEHRIEARVVGQARRPRIEPDADATIPASGSLLRRSP